MRDGECVSKGYARHARDVPRAFERNSSQRTCSLTSHEMPLKMELTADLLVRYA